MRTNNRPVSFASRGIPLTLAILRLPRWTARDLASLAREALIAEAELTPKPGLVDRRGSGAHDDLSLELMCQSATAIEPYFDAMASSSHGQDLDCNLRSHLAAIGRDAERAMYRATHGSNSHKGAIWILGLLVAAAIRVPGENAREIAATAGAIARLPDRAQPKLHTHGDIVGNRYGAGGARMEAANNFPHVIHCGLVMLRSRRANKHPEEVCRLDALLNLMAELDDTCVLYRGGLEALGLVKAGARAALNAGGYASEQWPGAPAHTGPRIDRQAYFARRKCRSVGRLHLSGCTRASANRSVEGPEQRGGEKWNCLSSTIQQRPGASPARHTWVLWDRETWRC